MSTQYEKFRVKVDAAKNAAPPTPLDRKAKILHAVLHLYNRTGYRTYESMPLDLRIQFRMMASRIEEGFENEVLTRNKELEEDVKYYKKRAKKLKKRIRAMRTILNETDDEIVRVDELKEKVRLLNQPMMDRLRETAADTSPNWGKQFTMYPWEAKSLVELIDAVEKL